MPPTEETDSGPGPDDFSTTELIQLEKGYCILKNGAEAYIIDTKGKGEYQSLYKQISDEAEEKLQLLQSLICKRLDEEELISSINPNFSKISYE